MNSGIGGASAATTDAAPVLTRAHDALLRAINAVRESKDFKVYKDCLNAVDTFRDAVRADGRTECVGAGKDEPAAWRFTLPHNLEDGWFATTSRPAWADKPPPGVKLEPLYTRPAAPGVPTAGEAKPEAEGMGEPDGMVALAIAVKEGKWPHTMDASVWAQEFCKKFPKDLAQQGWWPDESDMIGWFANAIMAGYDTAMQRAATPATSGEGPSEEVGKLLERAEKDGLFDCNEVPCWCGKQQCVTRNLARDLAQHIRSNSRGQP